MGVSIKLEGGEVEVDARWDIAGSERRRAGNKPGGKWDE